MKGIRGWFKDKWTNVKDFCGAHPEAVLGILGGLLTLAGGALEIYGNKTEYKDNVFMTDDEGDVYKVKAKKMKTIKSIPEKME